MKVHLILLFAFSTMSLASNAQKSELPYQHIPDFPDEYTANNVAARTIDGLGFRYYWATKDLREEDLAYKPSEDGRTTEETLIHIYNLTITIMNAPESKVNSYPEVDMTFEELRTATLLNIEKASNLLKGDKDGSMGEYKIVFQRGDNLTEYPFWNMLNGPLADAIYHTGQIVAFRRASGNPIAKGVRMFSGEGPN